MTWLATKYRSRTCRWIRQTWVYRRPKRPLRMKHLTQADEFNLQALAVAWPPLADQLLRCKIRRKMLKQRLQHSLPRFSAAKRLLAVPAQPRRRRPPRAKTACTNEQRCSLQRRPGHCTSRDVFAARRLSAVVARLRRRRQPRAETRARTDSADRCMKRR